MDQIRFPPQYRSPPLNTPIRPDFSNLRKTLEMQKQTNRININDNYIRDEGCKILANFLQSNPQIVSIDMKGNNITGRGLSDICEVLKLNKILKSLNLEWNSVGIDSIGLESLASYLTQNNSLNHLDLRNNRISQNDSAILAAIIRNNKSLISLDLRWNELGNVGANCIKTALKDNKTIQSLELSGNNVSEEITKDIQAFLENNRKNTPIINNEILFEKENILDVSNNGQKVEDLTMNHYKKELSENTNYIIKLEKTLEGEKQEHMKSKSRFEQEFNKWKTKEFEYNKIIHDLEIKNASLLEEKNNISIRFQDLTEENDNLQRKTNEMLKLQEERIEQQGSDMEVKQILKYFLIIK